MSYVPAESDSGMFGGNSNWRGPIWMPVNALIIRALLQYYSYYGDDFTVECPTGSGKRMTLYQVAEEIARRLSSIFVRNGDGRRPVFGGIRKFQEDPHWRDYLLFYEYFHGDNGAGLGASHQTGWTGVIARTLHLFATSNPESLLTAGRTAIFAGRVENQHRPDQCSESADVHLIDDGGATRAGSAGRPLPVIRANRRPRSSSPSPRSRLRVSRPRSRSPSE